MRHLFAYGTLICADIFEQVSGRRATGLSATLKGYSRRPVVGAEYPGVLPQAGSSVDGVVYRDLPAAAWRRLDRFEGEMYRRRVVGVRLASGEILPAEVYVVRPAYRHRLAASEWDLDGFVRAGKARFWREYRGFR